MVAAELVVAIFLSILGAFTLPRRSVRLRYAALDTNSRRQYWLFSGGSLILAISLWIDFVLQLRGQGDGSLFPEIIVSACFWILLLAGTEIPDLWNGRSVTLQRVPPSWPGGRPLYRALLRGMPPLVVGLLVFTLSVLASLLSRKGLLDGKVFDVLTLVSLVGIVLGLVVVVVGQPSFLVPPPLRGEPGVIQSWFSKGRSSGRRS